MLAHISRKFDSYFSFTKNLDRAFALSDRPGTYIYPNESMISDLTVLLALFSDVNQVVGGDVEFARRIESDAKLKEYFCPIYHSSHQGEFWRRSGTGPLIRVPDANVQIADVCKVLRDGFAHCNWRYEDTTGIDYWTNQNWDTTLAPADFNLSTRGANNYTAYIADYVVPRKPEPLPSFWKRKNLRILVSKYGTIRLHLHLVLNRLLNGKDENV